MMQADFALAVDPIFEFTLQSLAELDRGVEADPQELHNHLLNLFDRADSLQGTQSQWRLAKYALAAWIDEMLLGANWPGSAWWRDHILEMEFFQTRLCSVRFFEWAEVACAESRRDALEVFVNCVQLGFRGVFAGASGRALEPHLQSMRASSIGEWLKRMQPRLDTAQPALPGSAVYPQRIIEGAPPSSVRQNIIWWLLAAVILMLINGWALHGWAAAVLPGE